MRHWRAILRMTSPLATPLTAQRLFGHVCWGLAYREGPEVVADFLARMRGESPPLVIGQPMPVGFAPMPIVLQTGQVSLELSGKRQMVWQRYQRRGLMPRTALFRAASDLGNPAVVIAGLDASGWHSPMLARRQVRIRSAANRVNGTPLDRSDWLAVETWEEERQTRRQGEGQTRSNTNDASGGQMEVIIASDLEAGEIERLLQVGLENGFGRAASVGYGQVELAAVEAIENWPVVDGANALVTLGPCVPRRDDPANGAWQVQTQWGKLGGEFAVQTTAVEKRPVMTLKAGAVLTTVAGEQQQQPSGQWPVASEQQQPQDSSAGSGLRRDYVGRLVENVHPQRPEVVHYGLAPVLAVRV